MKVKGKRMMSLAVAVIAAFQVPEVQALIAEYPGWVGGFIGAAIAALRAVTTTPMFQSE